MDAFMKDGLNVKPVLLKQNAPEMDAFQHRLFNSQRATYFLLKPDAPKTGAFCFKRTGVTLRTSFIKASILGALCQTKKVQC